MLDNELAVETPEHVELSFALASIGNRFLACAIDHIIQALLIFASAIIARSFEISLSSIGAQYGINWVLAGGIVLVFLIGFGYFVGFETLWSGQTPGKRWMRLRVVRQDARPIGFYEAFVRNIIRLVDMMPMPSYFVGIASIFFSPQYRRLGIMLLALSSSRNEPPKRHSLLNCLRRKTSPSRSGAPIRLLC